MITRRRDLETVESVYRLDHPDSSSHRSALWYYKLFWYCSVPELLLILHWYSRIRSSSGTLVSEARSWRSVPEHNSAWNLRQNWDSSSSWITWLVNNGKVSEFYLGYLSSDLEGVSPVFCQPTHRNCGILALNCYGFDQLCWRWIREEYKMVMMLISRIQWSFFLLLFTWAVTVSAPTKPCQQTVTGSQQRHKESDKPRTLKKWSANHSIFIYKPSLQIFIAQYDCADHSWTTRPCSPLWINDGWWWRKLCHNMSWEIHILYDTIWTVHQTYRITLQYMYAHEKYNMMEIHFDETVFVHCSKHTEIHFNVAIE